MLICILSLAALAVLVIVAHRWQHNKGSGGDVITTNTACAECSSASTTCYKECMIEASAKDIEYFDDEELDAFRGRTSDSYTDDEAEQFAEVMLTMRPDEVKDWGRSLTLRGICLPDQLKDEYIMLAEG